MDQQIIIYTNAWETSADHNRPTTNNEQPKIAE